MRFPTPLIPATLIKRYKRFLADCTLENGEVITAHCANPGSMMGLNMPGLPVLLSRSDNPKRKLSHSLEMVLLPGEHGPVHVAINTGNPNKLVEEAILAGQIPELSGYARLRREVRYGKNSRIDILLDDGEDARGDGRMERDRPQCFVEVKNVHLLREPGLAEFPDSVTTRGAKHLVELSDMVAEGSRAVMIYLVQRPDCDRFALAEDLDPAYAKAFSKAREAGVEAYCLVSAISPDEITVERPIPILAPKI